MIHQRRFTYDANKVCLLSGLLTSFDGFGI